MSTPFEHTLRPCPRRERGGIAVIVALSALVLFGFAGLAIDLGRMYVSKTELQTAADACALAAAAELTCNAASGGTCPSSYLQNAEAAGIFAASRNRVEFQSQQISVNSGDVKFSTALAPNSSYLSRTNGASTQSRYVMCTARLTGLTPWFMALLGIGAQNIEATGVATLAPAYSMCPTAPIGICNKAGGYAAGEWITSNFTSNSADEDALSGSFRWVDYTPDTSGNQEIRDHLAGGAPVCGVKVGDKIRLPGTQQGAKSGYNTRFGIYPNNNAYNESSSPPDRTGYAYPNKNPGAGFSEINIGVSAYNDYLNRQAVGAPFNNSQYAGTGNVSGRTLLSSQHLSLGSDRRLVTAALINCSAGSEVVIEDMACVLMLNPMSNGANGTIYLEYRGLANTPGSPCRTGGLPGGPLASGPPVPTLVQ
ncbi:pilus assembly protein TadG-related protein [Caldimonas tepidiphila]|uniref:pilus assembly protein TadG-related protein n=1 Tax=Caldimonas tepidiphila TaxID=2315841 RepID=UPI0013008CCC|nr:Tad domain-containing protein [Caldimonas tepidiphila]